MPSRASAVAGAAVAVGAYTRAHPTRLPRARCGVSCVEFAMRATRRTHIRTGVVPPEVRTTGSLNLVSSPRRRGRGARSTRWTRPEFPRTSTNRPTGASRVRDRLRPPHGEKAARRPPRPRPRGPPRPGRAGRRGPARGGAGAHHAGAHALKNEKRRRRFPPTTPHSRGCDDYCTRISRAAASPSRGHGHDSTRCGATWSARPRRASSPPRATRTCRSSATTSRPRPSTRRHPWSAGSLPSLPLRHRVRSSSRAL